MVYDENRRESIYKWRLANREAYLKCLHDSTIKYYERNKEYIKQRNREYYHRKKAERLALLKLDEEKKQQ